jgi:hypothetical protein
MQTAARRDDSRHKRLYRSIEDGIVQIDDILREHTATLKSERKRAKAALDRARGSMRYWMFRISTLCSADDRQRRYQCPEGLHPLITDAVEGRPDHRQ